MNIILSIDLIDSSQSYLMPAVNHPNGSHPMPQDTAPRLSHVGLYVHDVPKMIDFYSNVLGFVVAASPAILILSC